MFYVFISDEDTGIWGSIQSCNSYFVLDSNDLKCELVKGSDLLSYIDILGIDKFVNVEYFCNSYQFTLHGCEESIYNNSLIGLTRTDNGLNLVCKKCKKILSFEFGKNHLLVNNRAFLIGCLEDYRKIFIHSYIVYDNVLKFILCLQDTFTEHNLFIHIYIDLIKGAIVKVRYGKRFVDYKEANFKDHIDGKDVNLIYVYELQAKNKDFESWFAKALFMKNEFIK